MLNHLRTTNNLVSVLLVALGIASKLFSVTAFAQEKPADESKVLPKQFELLIEQASKRQAALLDQGFAELAGKNESVKLTKLVKVLRAFGYGSKPPTEKANRGRGGRQGRGHNHGGGHGGGGPADRFAMLDTNGDKKLTGGEIGSRMLGTARAADGEVTLEEYEAAWAEMFGGGRRGGGGDRDQRGGNGRGNRGGNQDTENVERAGRGGGQRNRGGRQISDKAIGDAQFVLLFDSQRDRQVTKEELQAAIRQNLEAIIRPVIEQGSNGNGVVEELEAQTTPQTPPENRSPSVPTRADLDRDGTLTTEEIVKYAEQRSTPRIKAIASCLMLHDLAMSDEKTIEKSVISKRFKSDVHVAAALKRTEKTTIEKAVLYQNFVTSYRTDR